VDIYPKLICKISKEEEFLDYKNGEDDVFFERVGTEIAYEIAREAREQGRRSSGNVKP